MTIKAIETRYAGCRFRSRLEARWAVYFDARGLRWDYEPEGLYCSNRLDNFGGTDGGTIPYLPDFWLPDYQVWGEVKGSLDVPQARALLNRAASLSTADGEGCGGGFDLAVLGPIGREVRSPTRLHMHEGQLIAMCLWCSGRSGFCPASTSHKTIADDGGWVDTFAHVTLMDGVTCACSLWIEDAHMRARGARFEHGECG